MAFTVKIVHVDESIANLLEQFKGKAKTEDLVRIYAQQIQNLEDSNAQILATKDLNNATGQQLDDIGALVGEPRSGRNDVDYKLAIELRILINTSDGSLEDLISIVSTFDPSLSFEIIESFPAGLATNILAPVLPGFDPALLVGVLKTSRAGGIGLHLFYSTATPFQYDTVGGEYDVGEYATSVPV